MVAWRTQLVSAAKYADALIELGLQGSSPGNGSRAACPAQPASSCCATSFSLALVLPRT